MFKWTSKFKQFILVAGAMALSTSVNATLIDLSPTSWNTTNTGHTTFDGRGIYVRANQNTLVDSIGWFGSLSSNSSYEIAIFSGLGESAAVGPLLTVSAQNFAAGGAPGWKDIPTNFLFQASSEYYINFRRTDGATDFSDAFHYTSWGNGAQESIIGPFTLLDGRHGFAPTSNNNSWTTHFRINTSDNKIPEPTTLALIGLGLAGLGLARRKKT